MNVTFEEHCEQSIEYFGEPFQGVHQWLDEFSGKTTFRHRRLRHHEQGIQEIIKMFGEKAGRVARLHIISDLKEEGYWKGDPFPKDEEDYVRLGFR